MIGNGALERRLGFAIAGWALLLAGNNALPYVGLRDDSCQTMFCDMEWGEDWNTHYFMPQYALSDLWADLEVREVVVSPTPVSHDERAVFRWLSAPERDRNTEAVRVAVWQLCRSGHHVSFDARRTDGEHHLVHYEDACVEPAVGAPHLWIPVRLHDRDRPARPR